MTRRIYINDKEIVYEGPISMVLRSPIFDNYASSSFPFEIDMTIRQNIEAFNFANFMEYDEKHDSFDCRVECFPFCLTGKFVLEDIGNLVCRGVLYTDDDLLYKLKNTNLNDIIFEPVEAAYPYMQHKDFSTSVGLVMKQSIGINNVVNGVEVNPTDAGYILLPFFRLHDIAKGIFNYFGYNVDLNPWVNKLNLYQIYMMAAASPSEFRLSTLETSSISRIYSTDGKLCISFTKNIGRLFFDLNSKAYIILDMAGMSVTTAGYTIYAGKYSAEYINDNDVKLKDIEYGGPSSSPINYMTGRLAEIQRIRIDNINSISPSGLLPEISAYEFINTIEKLANQRFIYENTETSIRCVMLNDLVDRDPVKDLTNFWDKTFLKDIKKGKGYRLHFDNDPNDTIYAKVVKDIFDKKYTIKEAVDYTNQLPISGSGNNDVRLVKNDNRYFIFSESASTEFSKWTPLSVNVLDSILGDGNNKITISASPIINYPEGTERYSTPQNFDITGFKIGFNFNDIRLTKLKLIYKRGNYTWSEYPKYSGQHQDYRMLLALNASHRYLWDLYTNFHNKWLNYLNDTAREVNVKINWPIDLIAQYKWEDKITLKDNSFYVKNIPLNLLKDGIECGETVLITA